MTYELDDINSVIRMELNPLKLLKLENPLMLVSQKTSVIMQMIERKKLSIKKQLLLNETSNLTTYIPLNQLDIIEAWDILYLYKKEGSLTPGRHISRRLIKKNFDSIRNALKGLNWYIQQHCKLYCNGQQKISLEMGSQFLPNLQMAHKKLKSWLAENNIEESLKQQLLLPIFSCIQQKGTCSFNRFQYLQNYLPTLKTLYTLQSPSRQSIIHHLIVQGFNTHGFCKWLVQIYKQELNKIEYDADRHYWLLAELKQLRQLVLKNSPLYAPQMPSAKNRLKHWLKQEIRFQEIRKTQISRVTNPQSKSTSKIELSLSVYELALGARLFMEANLISENSFPTLARVITANFSTHKKEDLSLESFRKKSYDFERNVVNKIKDKIMLLLNLAQKF